MPKFNFYYRNRHHVIEGATHPEAYQKFRASLAAQAAANKAAKAAKLAHTMTCQCCGRAIFAETGRIAHHGYQRPGGGYQTASCMGARELPFEVSRDRLGVMLDGLKSTLAAQKTYRAQVQAETKPVKREIQKRKLSAWEKAQYETHELTRATFPAWKEANNNYCFSRGLYDFDKAKAMYLVELDGEIRFYTRWIKEQQARFDGWKQTHTLTRKGWKPL